MYDNLTKGKREMRERSATEKSKDAQLSYEKGRNEQ